MPSKEVSCKQKEMAILWEKLIYLMKTKATKEKLQAK